MNTDWDLSDLRVFCQVVRRSSFAGAAGDLGVSPAYVTKKIADLEKALDVRLFHRTTRKVVISEAGEGVYASALTVLEAAEELNQGISRAQPTLTGTLRVCSSLRLGRNFVSPILDRLHERHPGLDIWIELLDRRADLVAEGFDIDIRMGEVTEPNLIAHPVAENARLLCAAPAYLDKRGAPKSLAELAGHDCLLYRERHQTFGVWRMLGPQGIESVKVTGPMGSNHSDVVRNLALDGRGIILLAAWDAAEDLRSGRLVRVLPDYRQQADIWAVTAVRSERSAKIRTSIEFLIAELRAGPNALDLGVF